MRLARFTVGGVTRLGVVVGEEVADLGGAAGVPSDVGVLLAGGPSLADVATLAESAPRLALDDVKLEAPIARPPKFLAIGLNYADHIAETGMEKPSFPVFFNKQSTCVVGPGDPVHVPRASSAVDYEGELGVCLLYTSPSPRDRTRSRMPSSA